VSFDGIYPFLYSRLRNSEGARDGEVLRHCSRFPMVLLEFFIYIILPAALPSWGRLNL